MYGVTDLLTDATPPISLRDAVEVAAPRHVLLIAAGTVADEGVVARYLQRGSPATVEIWEVAGASHIEASPSTGRVGAERDRVPRRAAALTRAMVVRLYSRVRFAHTVEMDHKEAPQMRALVYHGPGKKSWDEVPDPVLVADTDAIVRVDAVTICGTDLHILKGDVPAVVDGRILGHEAVGTVESVGSGVKTLAVGDRVLVSCITSCGSCRFCREGRYGQCIGGGGWILGHLIDGTQAEYVRVPFADTSTYKVPAGATDEQILMLADILPTGYEVGVLNGTVQPGDVVAVVGAGPIGLAAIMGAEAVQPEPHRGDRPRRQPARGREAVRRRRRRQQLP